MRRFGLVLVCASLSLLLAAPFAEAKERAGSAVASATKGKAKKCKGKKVRVKIGKRTRCVPVKKALPQPKAEDPRLAVVREGLTPPIGSVRVPKGKSPVAMEKVYRQFGPKALPAMEKAVGLAIPKLDKLGASRGRSARTAAASAGGNTFSTTVGGVTIDARLSIAVTAAGEFAGRVELSTTTNQGGGKTLKVTTEVPLSLKQMGFKSDVCPGADGKLNATDGIGITVRSEVRSNGGRTLEEYFIYEVVDDTELQGIVGDDAKLDTLEIRSIEDVKEVAFLPVLGGMSAKGTVVRNTVVDMRTGEYRPSVTVINVGVALSGILRFFPGTVQEGVTERLKKAADKGFAATVDFETKKYRELEAGWRKPNTCAKLAFGHPNRSFTFHKGDKGTETARIDAARGGSPASAQWSLVSGEYGVYALNGGSANPNSFNYEVLFAGQNAEVKATIKAVSKAGIAEGSWIQKTEQKAIERIAGTFTMTVNNNGSIMKWSGSATFDRFGPPVLGGPNGSFKLSQGQVTVDASGKDSMLSPLCSQKGSKEFTLLPSSEFFVIGTPPDLLPPYDYSTSISNSSLPLPEVEIELFNCAPPADELEGETYSLPVPLQFNVSGVSADGFNYEGSESETVSTLTTERSWLFHGSE